MIELILNKFFDKSKAKRPTKLTYVREKGCENRVDCKVEKKTDLWMYFATMDGLNVEERGYSTNALHRKKEFLQSLDFCR
jgi:hypothetical protein